MIQINPLYAILTIEAVTVLFLLLVIFLFFSAHRKTKANNAAGTLIQKVNENEAVRTEALGNRIAEASGMDRGKLNTALVEITDKEKTLYRQIIKLFLNRDTALLTEIDQRVQGISEPYCALLEESRLESAKTYSANQQEDEALKVENHRLQQETERLANQLSTVMTAMDEVSTEYTKIFQGSKSVEELETSRQKMLGIY
ncbi:MAG: hypothetical protein V3V31_16100, partial [Methylococcales bacterium]